MAEYAPIYLSGDQLPRTTSAAVSAGQLLYVSGDDTVAKTSAATGRGSAWPPTTPPAAPRSSSTPRVCTNWPLPARSPRVRGCAPRQRRGGRLRLRHRLLPGGGHRPVGGRQLQGAGSLPLLIPATQAPS